MNILITGSKGFIGSHLVKYLSDTHNIQTLDIKDGQDLITCPLDYDVDCVIHLAAKSGVRDSLNEPAKYWLNNVHATQRIFTSFFGKRIIYASSSTAYEPWRNPYAFSKSAIEMVVPRKSNAIGLRFTTVYGDNARDNMFIPKLLNNQLDYVNTDHIRDFIHVDDICSAISLLIEDDLTGVIDVGTGKGNNLLDLTNMFGLDKIEKRIGLDTERRDNTADISILKDMGWEPKIDVVEYLKNKKGN